MQQYITLHHKKIVYHVYGTGKLVVLLHGFAEDHQVWKHQIEALLPNYKIIIPDLPGTGLSSIIPNMSMEGMADVVFEIIRHEQSSILSKQKIWMLGHSMGGYITLAFAQKYADCLAGFGLIHSTAYADTEEKKLARKKGIAFLQQYGTHEFLKQTVPNLFTPSFRSVTPDAVTAMIEQYKSLPPEVLVTYYEQMMTREDKTKLLWQTDKPVLFVMGEQDMAVPFQHSLQQCHLPQLSYIHILQQAAHMGIWEEKEMVNNIMLKFIQSCVS
jgi:pimeloyl-ACP methyl ester carboxylesterase